MYSVTDIAKPTKARTRFDVIRTFMAVSLIVAGGISTLAFTSSTIAEESKSDKTEQQSKNTDRDMTEFSGAVLHITNALVEGKISPAVAAEYISATVQRIEAAESYAAFEDHILAAYEAGEIAREDIGPELDAYKKALGAQLKLDTKDRLDAAVKSGMMSAEEARDLWGTHMERDGQGEKSITRKDYAQAEAKMKKMVAAGEITAQQMKKRLGEMRLMIGKQGITREDYAQAEAKMKEMVAAGEITAQQMKERLGRMRLMIGKQGITRGDYAKAEAKMNEMVASGEITQEKMDKVLGEMRKMISSQRGKERGSRADRGDRDDISDECLELRRRLGTAVRNGDMTREEAGEAWNAAGCSR